MGVHAAVATGYSCRAFLPTPVPEATVRDIVEQAARAPSGANLQAWRIYAIAGERIAALKAQLAPRMGELPNAKDCGLICPKSAVQSRFSVRRLRACHALSCPIRPCRRGHPRGCGGARG
jgi:nitroreductase